MEGKFALFLQLHSFERKKNCTLRRDHFLYYSLCICNPKEERIIYLQTKERIIIFSNQITSNVTFVSVTPLNNLYYMYFLINPSVDFISFYPLCLQNIKRVKINTCLIYKTLKISKNLYFNIIHKS